VLDSPLGPLWSSSWSWTLNFILHTFLYPIIIFFSQHMPIPTQPVLLQYQSSIPSLYLNSLLGSLSFSLTLHIQLTILISPRFYRAMLCIRGTSHGPVSVRLSVRPSQVGVLLKRINVGSHKQHHTIPQRL